MTSSRRSIRLLVLLPLILGIPIGAGGHAFQDPDVCPGEAIPPFDLENPWEGGVRPETPRCLAVVLEAGEFVRATVTMDRATTGYAGLVVEVIASGDSIPLLRLTMDGLVSERQTISWEAERSVPHFVVLRNAWMWNEAATQIPARVSIESKESETEVRARREALLRDPRVAWLAENALPVRSIDPEDEDFRDLEPLRASLEGVRIVLLGEADHASGSDFLARSRLVRFLHREMGFDVLAFESGLYGMAVAWDTLRAGASPRDAFTMGAFGFWSSSEQMQPLIAYVGEQAQGERPLEVAGFDNRPWLYWPDWGTSLPRFARDLAHFLAGDEAAGPLADPGSPELSVLEQLSARLYWADVPLPPAALRDDFLDSLDHVVHRLARSSDPEARFWAEAARGVACHAREVFAELSGEGELAPECLRDRLMGEHLIWLARERYPDRKIIAWAATSHVMREKALEQTGGVGPAMGQWVRDELGGESFALGMTSYRSEGNHIVADQHPSPEFEQLVEAAGFDYAIVDLRRAAGEGSWAGGSFPARPLGHVTIERSWSDALDALFFVRIHERRR